MSNDVPLQQLCYDIAYFILPQYVFKDRERTLSMWEGEKPLAQILFYGLACSRRGVKPDLDVLSRFTIVQGELDPERRYFVLAYPLPLGFDPENITPEDMAGADGNPCLPPYFSAIVTGPAPADVRYLILGQAPASSMTTLRQVTADGMNQRLGTGPQPLLADFLDAIRELE